jgi:hypothetical protein
VGRKQKKGYIRGMSAKPTPKQLRFGGCYTKQSMWGAKKRKNAISAPTFLKR